MIYFTGDTHGEEGRFEYIEGKIGRELGEGDIIMVAGDFGYVWGLKEKEMLLDSFESKKYTICFCDGNHENFDLLEKYPVEIWNGGKIHRVRRNVIHLMRGQVYEIDGKRLFTMGGGYSIDRGWRQEGFSWWRREMPSNDEYNEAAENLRKADMRVDYILTHTAPREVVMMMGKYPHVREMELSGFLEWVMHEVEFKKWYFGHWHEDITLTPKIRGLLFDIIECDEWGAT